MIVPQIFFGPALLCFTSNLVELKTLSIFLISFSFLKNALWLPVPPLPGRSASCFLQLLPRCGWAIHAGSESPTQGVNPFFLERLTLTASFITLFLTSFLILIQFSLLELTAFVSMEGLLLSSLMAPAGMPRVQCNHWCRAITAFGTTADMQRKRKGLHCLLQASSSALPESRH